MKILHILKQLLHILKVEEPKIAPTFLQRWHKIKKNDRRS